MEAKVNFLYQQYAQRFLKEWQEEGRYNLSFLVDNKDEIVKDQLEFILLYIGHMLIAGDFQENIDLIERFLSMQGAKNYEGRTEIRFLSGFYPEVFMFIEDLDDIDLADVMGITEFKTMHVYLRNGEHWTPETSEDFVQAVKEDLEYDGYDASLNVRVSKNLLRIKFKVV